MRKRREELPKARAALTLYAPTLASKWRKVRQIVASPQSYTRPIQLLNLEAHSFRTIEVCDDPACKRK
jgi:hypothetical protein